jgi:primosomal protein N' (replication factor Y)
MASFQEKQVSLLHGVTGSGKTELYIKLIAQTLMEGKQVLYLLPEIALTTQVISRLTRYFGEKAGVYHSKYNLYERVEIWNEVLAFHPHKDAKFQVIIGARSAIFLPFRHLGLVIVDEEHDTSYKQQDPAPRYNGRDAAIYLATQHQAKVLLGTATPSIETYFHAMGQKFGYIPLKERYGNLALPEIHVVNIQEEKKRDRMPSVFSEPLITAMEKAFADKKQVILFQNRRGFSLRLECQVCHWMPECKFCDVTLTYHKTQNMMLCHYCGYTEPVPEKCPECGSPEIFMKGYGTQQIEEELSMMYPDKVVKRLDLDTSRKKHGHQQIIHDFEAGKIDVLVGTQMVTKGLDFNHVSLVGIVDADSFLTYPDFRALERGFQLMAQVSGRSGRKDNRGQVIIQTRNPSHEAIQYVIENNYEDMFESQKLERYKFRYPPFYRMIRIDLKHKQSRKVDEGADVLARQLRKHFGKMVLGPEYPLVARVRNRYIKHILLKLPSDKALGQSKQKILKEIEAFKNRTGNKSIFIAVDVDPV